MNRSNDFSLIPLQRSYWQGEHGAAMLLSIMLMVVLSLLTITLFELLTASTQITGNHRLELRTLYIADAGVEAAINVLRDDPVDTDGNANFTDVVFEDGKYTVSTGDYSQNWQGHHEWNITSTGTVDGFSRKVSVDIKIIRIGLSDIYSVATTSWKLIPT